MDMKQKERVVALRSRGMGYAAIAGTLGVTKSQVSGYCRRAGIAKGDTEEAPGTCPECGAAVEQHPGRKRRRFCSDACRRAWWNAHPEMVRRRAVEEAPGTCPECGAAVEQHPGRKRRRFCSDACRRAWWNAHPEMVRRRAVYEFECACCGQPFTAYGNAGRKYCSHACYIADRFGKGAADGQA